MKTITKLRAVCSRMLKLIPATVTATVAISTALSSGLVMASESKTFCVYDPIGANGVLFQKMKDYQVAALDWGTKFQLKPYTDERVAEEDFKSGQCHAVSLTGIRGRKFNSFTGTIDSIGSVPSYEHMDTLLKTLSKSSAAKLMRSGEYEVVGIIPGGQVFLYVNDRKIDSVGEMSGKKLGVLATDPAQKIMTMSIGASPVNTSIATMYSQFNNRSIDIVSGPAIIYDAMELEKGLSPNGGILDYAVGQLTLQMLIRYDDFPADYGQRSREYFAKELSGDFAQLKDSEENIDAKWWVKIPPKNSVEYSELLRQARLSLREKGIYDGKMLTVLRKVRCKKNPTQSECTATDKE